MLLVVGDEGQKIIPIRDRASQEGGVELDHLCKVSSPENDVGQHARTGDATAHLLKVGLCDGSQHGKTQPPKTPRTFFPDDLFDDKIAQGKTHNRVPSWILRVREGRFIRI